MRWGRTSSPLQQMLSTPRHRGTKRRTTEPPMPLSLPFPFCPRSHCRQKAEAQTRHVHSGTRGGSQLCSSLLGHLFLFIVFKKGKKKRKKGFPITSPFSSPTKLPARTKFFQNLHFDRKIPPFLLSLLPCCRGQSVLWTGEELWHRQGRGKGVRVRTEEMRGTGALPGRDCIAEGWSRCGSI